jgi:hypothetical protein
LVARPAAPPVEAEKKTSVVEKETVTAIIVVPPVLTPEPQLPPAEITTQILGNPEPTAVTAKVVTRMVATKLSKTKTAGAYSFALGMFEQGSTKAITDSELVAGVKVLSKTPKVCTVSTSFDQKSSKYVIRVKGVSNGQCLISAIDRGSEVKAGSSLQIKQQVTNIVRKTS